MRTIGTAIQGTSSLMVWPSTETLNFWWIFFSIARSISSSVSTLADGATAGGIVTDGVATAAPIGEIAAAAEGVVAGELAGVIDSTGAAEAMDPGEGMGDWAKAPSVNAATKKQLRSVIFMVVL